jgi:hypothetical protein
LQLLLIHHVCCQPGRVAQVPQHQQLLQEEHDSAASKLRRTNASCTHVCLLPACLLQDVNKDPGAEETFKKIGEAYEVITHLPVPCCCCCQHHPAVVQQQPVVFLSAAEVHYARA